MGHRVLVVDDEPAIRASMRRMLRGHDVVEAASGAEAKRLLEQDQAFDLVLCDMMMPAVSGMDLHQWLTAFCPRLASQLVFITGGAFTPNSRDYLAKADNLRIEKPFDAVNLRKIVSELIVAARSRQ